MMYFADFLCLALLGVRMNILSITNALSVPGVKFGDQGLLKDLNVQDDSNPFPELSVFRIGGSPIPLLSAQTSSAYQLGSNVRTNTKCYMTTACRIGEICIDNKCTPTTSFGSSGTYTPTTGANYASALPTSMLDWPVLPAVPKIQPPAALGQFAPSFPLGVNFGAAPPLLPLAPQLPKSAVPLTETQEQRLETIREKLIERHEV